MLFERLFVAIAELNQQPRRALDVAEQEGDRSGRERPHTPSSVARFDRATKEGLSDGAEPGFARRTFRSAKSYRLRPQAMPVARGFRGLLITRSGAEGSGQNDSRYESMVSRAASRSLTADSAETSWT